MLLQEKLNHMLPVIKNVYVHITGDYGEPRPNGKIHKGIDFNYTGGQTGLNLTHPKIYSPVEGKVTFVGGNFGTIKIQDQQGYSHEILHTHIQKVKVGEGIKLGDELGTMGGKGPLGYHQYPQHVHYQIKNRQGECENPDIWWQKQPTVGHVTEKNGLTMSVASIPAVDLKYKDIIHDVDQEERFFLDHENNVTMQGSITAECAIVAQENILAAFEHTEGQQYLI